jgi:hypothetical protein
MRFSAAQSFDGVSVACEDASTDVAAAPLDEERGEEDDIPMRHNERRGDGRRKSRAGASRSRRATASRCVLLSSPDVR